MSVAPSDTGASRLHVALRNSGSCESCLARQRTDIYRLYGPSWKTVTGCSRPSSCSQCRPCTAPTLVSLLATWISDRSYVCDGRCGSNDPSSACTRGSKSALLSHFSSLQSAQHTCNTAPCVSEGTFRHILKGLCVRKDDLFKLLKETITCIGCRTFVETLFAEFSNESLGFLAVSDEGDICICDSLFDSPLPSWTNCNQSTDVDCMSASPLVSFCHALLSLSESVLWDEIDMTSECKKIRNARAKRCALHTLESHRSTKCHGWREIWEMMEDHERKKICQMDSATLHSTITSYVQKHKFCLDCKAKVMRAFAILAGELEPKCEKGFMPPLYKGIEGKIKEGFIEISPESNFVQDLIIRATPEALAVGTPNEVHAKTFDTAQEQVLLCVGLQLLKDLHQYAMACHLEYRGERLLILTSLMAITRQYQTALNATGCLTALDNYEEEQRQLQQKKKEKRLRKKKRKQQQQEVQVSSGCASATNSQRSSITDDGKADMPTGTADAAGDNDDDDDEDDDDFKEDSDDTDCLCALGSSAGASGCLKSTTALSSLRRLASASSDAKSSKSGGKVRSDGSSVKTASSGKAGKPSSTTTQSSGKHRKAPTIAMTTVDTATKSRQRCGGGGDGGNSSSSSGNDKALLSSSDSGCQADEVPCNISDDERVFLNKMGWRELFDDDDDTPCISQAIIDDYMANKTRHDEERQALRQHLWQNFENLHCCCLRKRC
eukprot:scpid51928/ scgid12041/ Gametogenetin-binding protein 2; Protein ZNF403